jgi:perosamine synthetase
MTADAITLGRKIINALNLSIGERGSHSLHEPIFNGNESQYVQECIKTGWVSSAGKYVDRFEADLSIYTNSHYCVAMANGTSALHIALLLVGVKNGDEVLMPAFTFIATANAVSYCGAIPHFIDNDPLSLGINIASLKDYLRSSTEIINKTCVNTKTGRVIRAIIPMHTFGHPIDIDDLLSLAKEFHLEIIEDAAESLGSFYKGKHTGTFGKIGIFSFNGNKIITTGGGGALVTNDSNLAKMAKHLSTTAKLPHAWKYEHDAVGYNYRMPNLNAALGCGQLEKLDEFLVNKRKLFSRYQSFFSEIEGVNLYEERDNCKSNYWLQTLILDAEYSPNLDLIIGMINNSGFMCRPAWTLISNLKPYINCPKMNLHNSDKLARSIINIPSSPQLIDAFE